jgi:hypothetical protein
VFTQPPDRQDEGNENDQKGVEMEVQVRVRDKDPLAEFLGWFSVGLGTTQLAAPGVLCKVVGASDEGLAPRLMRLMGARELTQGIGILARPRPTAWVWSRVAGDVLDLSLLGLIAAKNRKARTAFAIANVLAVTVPDIYESRYLVAKKGPVRSAKLIRKAVTIDRSRGDVEEAWNGASEVRRKIEDAGAIVRFAEAPGDRGTELIVEFEYDPPAGDLGKVAQKLTGSDLATQLSDDLRRFKQLVEAGEVIRSDAAPDGHLLAQHLKQRAARPLGAGAR